MSINPRASKKSTLRSTFIGQLFGDVDPVLHNGGYVLRNTFGDRIEWFINDPEDVCEGVLHIVWIPPCVMSQYGLDLARGCSNPRDFFKRMNVNPMLWLIHSRDPDIMERAGMLRDLGDAFGWTNLSPESVRMTHKELEKRWRSWLKGRRR